MDNTEQNQTRPAEIALERALKKHFGQNHLPDFGDFLLNKVLNRLDYERELKMLKPKLWMAVAVFLSGLVFLAFGVDIFVRAFVQTPIAHYLGLMFTDYTLVLANWQDYTSSLLESLPLGSLALLLTSVLGSLLLVDFAARRFVNFRKTLNALHYGK
jgi:hypothetical protein